MDIPLYSRTFEQFVGFCRTITKSSQLWKMEVTSLIKLMIPKEGEIIDRQAIITSLKS